MHPRDNDLLVGTHGRSFWIMADVTPLEQLSEGAMADAARVFPNARETIMWAQRGDWPFYGATYSAPNPPRATAVRYYLREPADGDEPEIDVVIRDASGAKVRTLTGPAHAGINEVLWDWRHDPPYEPASRGGGGGGGGGFGGGAPQGPIALPGTYTASIEVAGDRYEASFRIEADPRRPMTVADRASRQEALDDLARVSVPIYEAGQALGRIEEQLDAAEALIDAAETPSDALSEELETLRASVGDIREDLGEARRSSGVAGAIQGSSTLPTEDQLWQADQAWTLAAGVVEAVNGLLGTDTPTFLSKLYAADLVPSLGEAIVMPSR